MRKKCECNVCIGILPPNLPGPEGVDPDFWRRVQEQIRTFNQHQRNQALSGTILQGAFTTDVETPNPW
jgi:hypothetical protein